MEESIDLNEKYRLLYAHDRAIMHHFEDKNLSDDEYFHYGIYSDVVVNALSIIINLITDNELSIGIDNNCRAILEALSILKLDKCGGVGPYNKKMYRLFYASIEKGNRNGASQARNEVEQKVLDETNDKYKALQDIACEFYGCTLKDLKKTQKFGDPYFYLTNTLNQDTNILSILKKYDIDIDDHTHMYGFFSFMIHPRCEIDDRLETTILEIRHSFIGNVLDKVFAFIDETLPSVDTSDIQVPDQIFHDHLDLNHMLNDVLEIIAKVNDKLGTKAGYYSPFFLTKMESLIGDMMLCLFLGFNEMVTSKVKSFIEYYSIFNYLLRSDSKETYFKTLGFTLGSRLQMDEFTMNVTGKYHKRGAAWIEDINYVFDNYYKDAYSLTNVNSFIKNLCRKNLYALYKDPMSYTKVVKDEISLGPKEDYDRIMQLYSVSLDMEHASGYNFNQSPMVAELYANESVLICLHMINGIVAWIDKFLKENNDDVDFSNDIKYLDYLIQTFMLKEAEIDMDYMDRAAKHYSEDKGNSEEN